MNVDANVTLLDRCLSYLKEPRCICISDLKIQLKQITKGGYFMEYI